MIFFLPFFGVQVTVRDDGRPPLSSTTRIVVEVADINDHGPEFEQKFYTVQIPATPSTDKPFFQVRNSPVVALTKNIFANVSNVFLNPPEDGLSALERDNRRSCFHPTLSK